MHTRPDRAPPDGSARRARGPPGAHWTFSGSSRDLVIAAVRVITLKVVDLGPWFEPSLASTSDPEWVWRRGFLLWLGDLEQVHSCKGNFWLAAHCYDPLFCALAARIVSCTYDLNGRGDPLTHGKKGTSWPERSMRNLWCSFLEALCSILHRTHEHAVLCILRILTLKVRSNA